MYYDCCVCLFTVGSPLAVKSAGLPGGRVNAAVEPIPLVAVGKVQEAALALVDPAQQLLVPPVAPAQHIHVGLEVGVPLNNSGPVRGTDVLLPDVLYLLLGRLRLGLLLPYRRRR